MSMKLARATTAIRLNQQTRREPQGSSPREVQGLVFDTGDVLYDATVWRRWLLKVLGRLGLCADYRSFYRTWDRDFLADVHRGRRDFWEAFGDFLLSAGLARGQIEEIHFAAQAQHGACLATARLFPCVRSTLGQLRGWGVRLAAICDSELSREAVQRQLERMGLGGVFGAVVCSQDLGHAKPEAACYLAALDALDLPAGLTAFVGHDADELAAAARLGMTSIAFNHDPEVRADVYLRHFDELVDLIFPQWPLAAAG